MRLPPAQNLDRLIRRYAFAAIVLILCGFAVAGLFPFDPSPENHVSWIEGRDGLRFRRGSAFGTLPETFDTRGPCSIELYLEPTQTRGAGTILGFYDGNQPSVQIEQIGSRGFRVVRNDPTDPAGIQVMWLPEALEPEGTTLITLTAEGAATRVYIDGILVLTSQTFQLDQRACSKNFVLGTGVTSDATWIGSLIGLAVYSGPLAPEDVVRHSVSWRSNDSEARGLVPAPEGLYLFDEQTGDVVYNHRTGRSDIAIPASYRVPVRTVFERVSLAEVRMRGPNWPDIVINVVGFIPFGFFLFSLITFRWSARAALPMAIVGGMLVSLSIEVLQVWLPTRSSSLADVWTNTAGAAFGACLYWRLFFSSARIPSGRS